MRHRWCLTGTPVRTSVEDLTTTMTFLRQGQLNGSLRWRPHEFAYVLQVRLGTG